MATVLVDSQVVLRFPPPLAMSPDQFFDFSRLNPDLRLELSARGEVVIVPTGFSSGKTSNRLNLQLGSWAEGDNFGTAVGPDTGFRLPNGSVRAPDASWTTNQRLAAVPPDLLAKFPPLCPDFVAEVRSPSDRLEDLQEKMREYMDNGARLGWLVDPQARTIHVYLPGSEPVVLADPKTVSGEPVLPGFVLDASRIW